MATFRFFLIPPIYVVIADLSEHIISATKPRITIYQRFCKGEVWEFCEKRNS